MTFEDQQALSQLTGIPPEQGFGLYRTYGDPPTGPRYWFGAVFYMAIGDQIHRFAPAEQLTDSTTVARKLGLSTVPNQGRWRAIIEPLMLEAKVLAPYDAIQST